MLAAEADEGAALYGAAQLDYGDDHLSVQLAAVVAEDGVEGLEVAGLGKVGDDGAAPGRDLDEAHAREVLEAEVDDGLADLHLLGEVALGGEPVAGLERAGEDHALDTLDEQLFYCRRYDLSEIQMQSLLSGQTNSNMSGRSGQGPGREKSKKGRAA